MTNTKKKGTSLVELLAVIVIMGIIAAIAVPTVGALLKNTRQKAAVSDVQALVSSIETYASSEDFEGTIKLTDGAAATGETATATAAFIEFYQEDPSVALDRFKETWTFTVKGSKVIEISAGKYNNGKNTYSFTGTTMDALKAKEA